MDDEGNGVGTNHLTLPKYTQYQLVPEVGVLLPDIKKLTEFEGAITEAPDYRSEEKMSC